jgi:hypothetical protein
MPICLGPGEILCQIVLSIGNSLRAPITANGAQFEELMQPIGKLMPSGIPTAQADVEELRTYFNTPTIWRVYENTREPNCKGIKEREALRRLRTGADAVLAG